nr:MAG TPA: hypothetical protein [Caudoviricetes sp.]
MSKTSFEVIYDLKDTTALQDSIPSTMDNQNFAVESLLRDNTAFSDYGTLEQDYFLLDGTMPELPDKPEGIPFWSSELSDENGLFQKNPVLIILFSENHTSTGLTFHFVGEIPVQFQVRWYDLAGNMIALKSFQPDSRDYYARNLVENYGRLEVEFQKAKPYRYVKLWGIDYGVVVTWNENDIKTASLVEETDPISNTLKINKLTFQFIDRANEFNLANSEGLHKALQKKQHIEPYEIVDGERLFLGRYFLTTPGSEKSLAKMEATDYIGLLDDTDFKDGRVYNGELAGNVLAEIFAGTDIPFEVAEDVAATPLYGWLKIQTRRKALREVLFACGAVAETARRDNVWIYKPSRLIQSDIPRSRKFSTATKQDTYISEVSIKFTEYTEGAEEKELVKETTYPAGLNEVKFNSPVSALRVSTGEVVEAKTNYIIFRLSEEAAVTIYGRQYSKQDITVSSSVPQLKAGENPKAKSFTGTLFNYGQAKIISQAILDYYQLSLILNIRYLAAQERPGQWASVENTLVGRGGYAAGLESIKTDLTGGDISTAQLRGYYKYTSEFYYTGTELYIDESVGDI